MFEAVSKFFQNNRYGVQKLEFFAQPAIKIFAFTILDGQRRRLTFSGNKNKNLEQEL